MTQFETKSVTLEVFLSMVPETTVEGDSYSFNTLISQNDSYFSNVEFEGSQFTYAKRHLILLEAQDADKAELVMLQNLLLQARHIHLCKAPMEELIEEMAIRHLEVYGLPEVMVEVRDGLYLIANPEDFVRVRSDRGVGLACLYEARTLVFSELPFTRAEADALVQGKAQ